LLDTERRDFHLEKLLTGVKAGAKYVTGIICQLLGMCGDANTDATTPELQRKANAKNPFSVSFNQSTKTMILVNSSIELEYLPHLGERPNLYWMPTYDMYTAVDQGNFEWLLVMDLPGVLQENLQVYCPMQFGMEVRSKLGIVGHRHPPTYLSNQRQDTPFTRKYGSFAMTINLPDVLSCPTLVQGGYQLKDGVMSVASKADLLQKRFSQGEKGKLVHHDELKKDESKKEESKKDEL